MDLYTTPHFRVNPILLSDRIWHIFSTLLTRSPKTQPPSYPWPTSDPVIPIEGEAVVEQPIAPYGRGRVYYQGSWWPATSMEEVTLLKGQLVKAVERQNITLLVTPVASYIHAPFKHQGY